MSTSLPDYAAFVSDDQHSKRIRPRLATTGLIAPALGALLLGGGCPPAPQDAPREETVRLDVVFDRTGFLIRDNAFRNMTLESPLIGDLAAMNTPVCAFVSVNLNALPADANVTRVVLSLLAFNADGDPFAKFGTITVDHVNVVSGITASDYAGGTISAGVATVTAFAMGTTRDVSIDVTDEVNADRAAGRPISSFRFRFDAAPSIDAVNDLVLIAASPNNQAQRPSATVTIRS